MRKHTIIRFGKGVTIALLMGLFMWLTLAGLCSGQAFAANFIAPELLGRPTDTSITVNAVADVDLEVYLEYRTASGTYTKMPTATFTGGSPIEIVIDGLEPNTRYYYRMNYGPRGGSPGSIQP